MTFDLTPNELRAALILVKACLKNMGGKRPADLDTDPLTWVTPSDLMEAGYSAKEAAGTFGSLMDKAFIDQESRASWTLRTKAWRWLDAVWDQTESKMPEVTKKKIITTFVHPPIPLRNFDWCATYDGEDEEGNRGWGATDQEAILALISQDND